jgi:pyruvate formate-lyase/glycerol dehydratase family glycyl radical enzyme
LIVGNAASQPMAVELEYDYGTWSDDEIGALRSEGYDLSAEDEAELIDLNRYWRDRTLVAHAGRHLDDERLWPFAQSGIVLSPWKTREEGSGGGYAQSGMGLGPGFFLCAYDFERVLTGGLKAIVDAARAELHTLRFTNADAVPKADFLRAVIISHEAVMRFAGRFAELAAHLAAREPSPDRGRELEEIAEICRRVPSEPARTFREAIQSFWFMFLVTVPQTTAAAGRFDQYMNPFYCRDLNAGRTDSEQALELLQCLRVKDMQLNRTSGKRNRLKNAGMAKWHNWTIGGVTPDGADATNELTYLILEAARRCPTPHHTITLRVHEGTPDDLMIKALELVKTGIGMPAFVGDRSYVDYLALHGVALDEARDYVITGCLDVNLTGRSRIAAVPMFIVPLVLDIFIRDGVDPNTGFTWPSVGEFGAFESFEDLLAAFKEHLAYFMGLAAERNNIDLRVARDLVPDALRSSLMADATEVGKDMLERSMPFENGAVLNAVGMINVADSLVAIKKLVFDDEVITLHELKAALAANWQGEEAQRIRRLCLAAPKYGNDDDVADSVAADLYRFWADTTESFGTAFGGTHKPSAISITSQAPGGALTGATPDGRYAGECLADGTMSAMRGRDIRGITSLLKSAAKIDQTRYQSTLLNIRFHPSALTSDSDLRKLSALIGTYFALGGKHMQFNVVTAETLLDAQVHPELYRDLVVRVAGYSAYFVQLGRAIQDEIIERTIYESM